MKFAELEYSTQVIAKVIFAGLALAFLWVVRDIVAILLLSLVLASAIEPLADRLSVRKIPRAVSVLVVYLVVLGIVALIASFVVPIVTDEAKRLAENLPAYSEAFHGRYPTMSALVGSDALTQVVTSIAGSGSDSVVSRTAGIFNGLFGVVTVLVISFYLVVAGGHGMKELVRPLVPRGRREQVVQIISKIQHKMGLWVLGQLILSGIIFLATYIGLSLLGVRYALVLALIAGLFEVIPYIGPILSALPAAFVAFMASPGLAIGVIILYVLIQKSESYILVPKVMEKTIGVSPLIVLMALLIGFKLAGIIGLLLAIPLASAIVVVAEELTDSGIEKIEQNLPQIHG